jgi:hypothetical protein
METKLLGTDEKIIDLMKYAPAILQAPLLELTKFVEKKMYYSKEWKFAVVTSLQSPLGLLCHVLMNLV